MKDIVKDGLQTTTYNLDEKEEMQRYVSEGFLD